MGSGGSNTDPDCITGTQVGSAAIVVDWSELGPDFDAPTHFVGPAYPELDALRIATQEPIIDADVRMIGQANGPGEVVGEAARDAIYVDLRVRP